MGVSGVVPVRTTEEILQQLRAEEEQATKDRIRIRKAMDRLSSRRRLLEKKEAEINWRIRWLQICNIFERQLPRGVRSLHDHLREVRREMHGNGQRDEARCQEIENELQERCSHPLILDLSTPINYRNVWSARFCVVCRLREEGAQPEKPERERYPFLHQRSYRVVTDAIGGPVFDQVDPRARKDASLEELFMLFGCSIRDLCRLSEIAEEAGVAP